MNKRTSHLLLVVIYILTAGLVYYDVPDRIAFATLNVRIEKDSQDVWRIRDLNGHSQGMINASSNDNINWQTRDSEVVFAFQKDVNKYFEYRGNLFEDGRTQRVRKNGNLRVTIKEDAPADTLHYEVYVVSEGKFVKGNSPPVIIIKK